eukprot:6659572-Pyramimonas_sp.AAC.1
MKGHWHESVRRMRRRTPKGEAGRGGEGRPSMRQIRPTHAHTWHRFANFPRHLWPVCSDC